MGIEEFQAALTNRSIRTIKTVYLPDSSKKCEED